MAAFASLLAASAALRVASLNLCSDEYLLLLAHPGEVVSVSRLSQDPQESILAPLARRVAGNRGRIEDVIAARSGHPALKAQGQNLHVVLTFGRDSCNEPARRNYR